MRGSGDVMRIVIAAVGRMKQGADRELLEHYGDRLETAGRGVSLAPLQLTEIVESRAATVDARKRDEAQRLVRAAAGADVRVALDERGKAMSSEALTSWIKTQRDSGCKTMAFLIGGPDGHGAEALDGAALKLALGPLTLPHGLARIVLVE